MSVAPAPALRTFAPGHIGRARELWSRTPGVGLSAADEDAPLARFLLRNPGLSHVVELDGAVVGTILCGHDGRRGLIHHLVVSPGLRRRGYGRLLLDTGLQGLRAAGIDKVHVLVFQSNAVGHAFWTGAGARERVELTLFSLPTDGQR